MALSRTNVYAAEFFPPPGSFTPPANSLLVVSVGWGSSDDNTAGITPSGGGLTYTPVDINAFTSLAPGFYAGQQIWTAPVGASPSSMTLSFSRSPTLNGILIDLHVVAYTGYDTGTPTGVTGKFNDPSTPGAGTPESITLSGSPASSSVVFASIFCGANSAAGPVTPGSGWTEIYDWVSGDVNGLGYQSQERTGSTSATVSWANVDTNGASSGMWGCGGIAVEIKAAGGGGGSGPVGKIIKINQTIKRASFW